MSLLVSTRPDGKCEAIPTYRLADYEKDCGADHGVHVGRRVEKRPKRNPYQRHERPPKNEAERLLRNQHQARVPARSPETRAEPLIIRSGAAMDSNRSMAPAQPNMKGSLLPSWAHFVPSGA